MADQMYTEEYRREWALEILKLLVKRKNHLDETLRITKEFGDALSRNDRVTLNMLLQMRGKELEHIDEVVTETNVFRQQLIPQAQKEIQLLFEGGSVPDSTDETDKISEMVQVCNRILQDIIEMDKRMSRRVAGPDSFYAE